MTLLPLTAAQARMYFPSLPTDALKRQESLLRTLSPVEAVEGLLRIPVASYSYSPEAVAEHGLPALRHHGVIAQDVEAAGFPELVSRNAGGDLLVNYQGLAVLALRTLRQFAAGNLARKG